MTHTQRIIDEKKQVFIQEAIEKISQLKCEKKYKEADHLKTILRQKHSIQIFCRNDGSFGWVEIDDSNVVSPTNKLKWSLLERSHNLYACSSSADIPLVVATVNLTHYRLRLKNTLEYLSCPFQDGSRFHPIECIDMLRLDKNPSLGVNRIVFEGWRQILLPAIQEFNSSGCNMQESIAYIAEDDVRFFSNCARQIHDECSKIFADTDLHILSLGHRHAPKKPSRRQRRRSKRGQCSTKTSSSSSSSPMEPNSSLFEHLQGGGKVHGSTMLAIRCPHGVNALMDAMDKIQFGKRSHFDQFLFHSTDHDLAIAFSDPPLAGWTEVEETLTSVGNGCRRHGGGRMAQCPDKISGVVQWVRREVVSS